MSSARITTMLALAGAALLATPAMAQVNQAEAQAMPRSLERQGYSDVRITQEGDEVVASASREGETHRFAWDRDEGRLEPLGGDEDNAEDDGRPGPGDDGSPGAEEGEDGGREGDDTGGSGDEGQEGADGGQGDNGGAEGGRED